MDFLSFDFSYSDLALFVTVALLIGMAKTGIHGAGMAAVPLLALVFGGKLSSGIMLPLLCLADIIAVIYYNRHAQWRLLAKLLPWAAVGVLIGTYIGDQIDDQVFRLIMGITILVSIVIMVWRERSANQNIPTSIWFAIVLGILGGFTTMVGNLAGSVMALYLLSMRLPKNAFIGTGAWFFLIINWFKIPFHIFVWETITLDSFLLDLSAIPFIILGAFLGIKIVKLIPEKTYRYFVILSTAAASILMLI
ncbi:MAG: putative membrane protein YfcA [Cyclobacteriaceae bacterium]